MSGGAKWRFLAKGGFFAAWAVATGIAQSHWEVLNGVGADGVGVQFPNFPVSCSCFPSS